LKTNRLRVAIIATAVVGGLLSGSFALNSASLAQPPLRWGDLTMAFVGCVFAILFTLGFQAIINNKKAFVWGWSFLALGTVYFFTAGVSGAALSFTGREFHPSSFFFIVIGCGLAFGLAILRIVFSGWFKDDD